MMTADVNCTDQMVMLTKEDPHYFEHVTAETNRVVRLGRNLVGTNQDEQFPGVTKFLFFFEVCLIDRLDI